MKKIIYTFALVALILISCEKNDNTVDATQSKINLETVYSKSEFNLDMRDFALAVNEAINANNSFRKLVKEVANQKNDGDYDVLISKIANLKLSSTTNDKGLYSRVNTARQEFTVKDLLEDALNSVAQKTQDVTVKNNIAKMNKISANQSVVDVLTSKYPELQVSVPVHIEDLENIDYIPPVTFITSEAYRGTAEYLVSYQGDETILLDAKKEPENAVVVVGLNERYDELIIDEEVVPDAPVVTGLVTEAGIRLTWSVDNIDNVNYFEIYRKTSSLTTLEKIALISSTSRPYVYDDNNVLSNVYYTYYVKSVSNAGEAWSSPLTFKAPQKPNPVKSFVAILQGKNEVELRWDNDISQYISSTKLYRRFQGVDNDYLLYENFNLNDSYYFDRDVKGGDRVYYRITHNNDKGESDGRYDFVYMPYRNILEKSPIILDKISYSWEKNSNSDDAIEGWFQGLPEFQIKILTVDSKGGTAVVFDEKIEATSKSSFSCNNLKLHDWLPSNLKWYDVLTFKVVESDPDWGTMQIKVDAKANAKAGTDTLGGSVGLVATYTSPVIKFGNRGDDMGIPEYYTYFDPISYTLEFSNFNFKMYLK